MKCFYLIVLVFCLGCSQSSKEELSLSEEPKTGFFSSASKWVSNKFKSEEEIKKEKAEEEEKEKIKREEAINKYKISDDLVSIWIEKLDQKKSPNGNGYLKHEGLTEVDAWGNFIKVEYKQDVFYENLIVTSLGSDGIINTNDDLVRTRQAQNPLAFYKGIGVGGWFVFAWVVSIPLSLGLLTIKLGSSKRKNRRRKHPFISSIVIMIIAPFFLIGMLISTIFSLIGSVFNVGGQVTQQFGFFDFVLAFSDLNFSGDFSGLGDLGDFGDFG